MKSHSLWLRAGVEFKTITSTCETCKGHGSLSEDPEAARDQLEMLDQEIYNKEYLWEQYQQGIVECPVCEGEGEVTSEYPVRTPEL